MIVIIELDHIVKYIFGRYSRENEGSSFVSTTEVDEENYLTLYDLICHESRIHDNVLEQYWSYQKRING